MQLLSDKGLVISNDRTWQELARLPPKDPNAPDVIPADFVSQLAQQMMASGEYVPEQQYGDDATAGTSNSARMDHGGDQAPEPAAAAAAEGQVAMHTAMLNGTLTTLLSQGKALQDQGLAHQEGDGQGQGGGQGRGGGQGGGQGAGAGEDGYRDITGRRCKQGFDSSYLMPDD